MHSTTERTLRLSDFDLTIPEHLIAQFPDPSRDQCRLMVLDCAAASVESYRFYQLPQFLNEGDTLVLNDTQVFPARLFATKAGGTAEVEVVLLRELATDHWEVLVKPARRVRVGDRLNFTDNAYCEVADVTPSGGRVVHMIYPDGSIYDFLDRHGQSPLPPYIRRTPDPTDKQAYQTVYARHRGAVAAPTAGLHFTRTLLDRCAGLGVNIAYLTLHVGLGTFRPVKDEDITQHKLDAEFYRVTEPTAVLVNRTMSQGKRVIAVGTTTARVLETVAVADSQIAHGEGWTTTFIYPPYHFKIVNGLVTNFHLPRSSLLMLVSAFAGQSFLFDAYRQAVREEYRFYSYGDAMLIL